MYGGFYPVGGAKEIALHLLQTVADAGGWTRISTSVDEILVEKNRAQGVRLATGEVLRASQVVSAVGLPSTVRKLLPQDLQETDWARSVSELAPASAHVCLYLGFEGDIRSAGCGAAIRDGSGRLLLIQRLKEPEAGAWGLPGGKIDFGERSEDTARREIEEELGIVIEEEGLREIILPELSAPVQEIHHRLPATSSHNYLLDLPLGAIDGLREISSQPWRGAFLTFDYGKSWEELTQVHPKGTARVYESHRTHDDLLANPGEVDLTCHLCWDFLTEVLEKEGFAEITIERQESYFMKRASPVIRNIIENQTRGLDEERQTLQELLHPSLMGDAFQALSAKRLEHP